jgi:AbrB family looped-hinge helix DNA binding protein
MSIEVGKFGRIVLPKRIRKKYGVHEGIRLIVTESMGHICLVPVKIHVKPTEALYGSIKLNQPIDEPKAFARQHIRKKLLEETL